VVGLNLEERVLKAIQTLYKGYRFRSRLEARWAVFFTEMNMPWQYEAEGYELPSGRYLPDFWIPFDDGLQGYGPWHKQPGYFIEIKGSPPSERELRFCRELTAATDHHTWLFQGDPGDHVLWRFMNHPKRGYREYGPRSGWEDLDGLCVPYPTISYEFSTIHWEFAPWLLIPAITAARSARFEYGETPL